MNEAENDTPGLVRLSDGLGAWWKKLTHKHAHRQRKSWGMLDGHLVCLRTIQCDECGHKMEQTLLLIATPSELAEAASKQIASPEAPNARIHGPSQLAGEGPRAMKGSASLHPQGD